MKSKFKISVIMLILLAFIGCKQKPSIDTPIVANDFHDLLLKVENTCKNIKETDCEHIWALIQLSLPEAKNSNFLLQKESEVIASELFTKMNGKTPRELLQIYKSDMIQIIQLDMDKDKERLAELDTILDIYNVTSKHIKSFTVNGVKNSFLSNSANVMWNIYNGSKFNVSQIVGYVSYYGKNNLLYKSPEFVHKFNPELMSGERLTILVNIGVEPDMIKRLRADKNLRVEVKFRSMNVTSGGVDKLIFELPESYHKMRELLKRSEELYKERIDLINNIRSE